MRVLLDACLPRRLKLELGEHDVQTAREARLNTVEDGELLEAIAGKFDVFITMDKSMRFQQQLDTRPFAVVLLRAKSNRLPDLLPLTRKLVEALGDARPGEFLEISV